MSLRLGAAGFKVLHAVWALTTAPPVTITAGRRFRGTACAAPFLLCLPMVSPGSSYGGGKADSKASPICNGPKVGQVQPLKSQKELQKKHQSKGKEDSGTVPAPGRHIPHNGGEPCQAG